MSNSAKVASNPFDIFVIGARKGFNIAINNLMPNVLMAYVIAEMLNLLGVMQIIGHVCAPLMGLFGLPGEAITVLLTSWLSASAGTDFPHGFAASVHGAPARRGGCPEKILAATDGGEHYQCRHRHAGHARDCIIEGKE